MLGKLTGWEDTIIALATPPGIGAIGVIRVSGPASFSMVNALFPSKDLEKQESHTLHVGSIREADALLDEVVVSLFRGPKSYTGEDVVEISCHGSPYVQQRVIEALLRQGGRLARAGEFTQRAFLNGKLDLAQAEAVADLIASNTDASAKAALHTMRGGFSNDLFELREQLMSFSALIELELDFSQEDVEFADRTKFYQLVTDAERITSALLASFRLGNVIRNGVQVAIVGKPNAGKSTLLNTLLNENRAIVSEIAGTTRDTIEETLNIDGILFRLIDTAGIRRHSTDAIEQIGVGKSLEKMEVADVVLYVFDVGDEVGEVLGRKEELTSFGVGAGGGLGAGAAFGGRGAGGENAEAGDAGGAAGTGEGEEGAGGEDEDEGGAAGEGAEAPGGRADKVGEDGGSPGVGKPAGNGKRFLWVGNKVDALVDGLGDGAVSDVSGTGVAPDGSLRDRAAVAAEDAARRKFAAIPDAIFISAKRQQHIDVLKQRLVDQVLQGNASTEGTIVTNARHYHALQQVGISLAAIRLGLDAGLPGDLLALDIRHCLHYLGEITGEITSEDRLGYIFGKFCIGK